MNETKIRAAGTPSGAGATQRPLSEWDSLRPVTPPKLSDDELTDRICRLYAAMQAGEMDIAGFARESGYLAAGLRICIADGCVRSAQIEDVCGVHLGQR